MKQFEIPDFYKSPIISKVKALRKEQDPRKKDFTPTILDLGSIRLVIARHFGFCYGVENAIEIAYKAIAENHGKRVLLLSQMIHNPAVNEDLTANGIQFIQDTEGKQLIPWEAITHEDVVIIPAFGTTVEIENLLISKNVDINRYNTTCPFVEKVWNRAEKLGREKHTLIIHGKYNHEETRATFSHTASHTQAVIVKNLEEAIFLTECMTGIRSKDDFYDYFNGKHTPNFDPDIHFEKLGVINQTTMLASETQEIAEYIKEKTTAFALENNLTKTVADTRDTLCYATNDNQSATLGLMEEQLDFAIVVGGYNSSNTTHLVELLEQKCPTFFIKDNTEFQENGAISSYNIHNQLHEIHQNWIPKLDRPISIAITSGASCPDATVDGVIQRLLELCNVEKSIETVIEGY